MPARDDTTPQRNIFSVSRLNREARALLEGGFPRLWVEGEISNLARPASGHLYFTLKDARAQVSCALFRNRALRLDFTPENGTQVLLQAQVSLYEARGNYQLIVDRMEAAGDGALRRAFEVLKAKLYAEGLFDPDRKQPLPELPRCIGVVTSPGGAAIRDVLTVLGRRFPAIPVIIYPTQVQGDGAAAQIVRALQRAGERADCDVLLLTRGGGSLEDLWPFNEETVARAVYACPLPVVSAVGHEIDTVISDYVADARAATPSAAAELLSPDQNELAARVRQLENRLLTLTRQHLQSAAEQLERLTQRIQQSHPGRRLQQQAQRLDELDARLRRGWQYRLARQQARLDALRNRLEHCNPQQQLQRLAARTAQLAQQLEYCINKQVAQRHEKLAVLARALDAVSPLATLQRGYSITLRRRDAAVLQDAREVSAGEQLETRLANGRIFSQVTGTKVP
ncbi:MAG TPA: exodeoxyribonuclease VII large subunit [Gammaproteobacteria bacterium]|nr:exodeoxyribonuclease VII large subunit [Gammaproteobacteria bacterium]